MRCVSRFGISCFVLLAGTQTFLKAAAIYNFDADALGKTTPFTDTVSGLAATFTSSGDPAGFAVGPTFFSALMGNVLLDPGPAGLNNLALTIFFSTPQTSISLNFAINSAPGVLFNLNAFGGASAVGSAAASGVIPLGFSFPEGVISFSGPAFDRVVLSSSALNFAIDNVTVDAIPEPSALWLLTLGMLGSFSIAWLRRRGAYGERMSSQTRIHAD